MSDIETVPTSEFRKNVSYYVASAPYTDKRIIITRNGKPVAALISMDDLELLLEGENFERLQAEDDGMRVDDRDFLKSMKGD